MAIVSINETYLINIANAIRSKNGSSDTYKPKEMAAAIRALVVSDDSGGTSSADELVITADITTIADNAYANDFDGSGDNTFSFVNAEEGSQLSYLGYGAFAHNKNLVQVDLSWCDNLTILGKQQSTSGEGSYLGSCFWNCSNLWRCRFPLNLKVIGDQCFLGCSELVEIDLPDTLTHIGYYAFGKCGMDSIIIPASVQYIGDDSDNGQSFAGCPNLRDVYFQGTPYEIDATTFSDCPNLTDIYVPWSNGTVANAPWGATNATIHYNW